MEVGSVGGLRTAPMRSSLLVGALATAIGTLIASLLSASDARAQQEYFKGKTIQLVVGAPQGGGYWLLGKLFADHLPRFLPGQPTVVTPAKPGSFTMPNDLYAQAPADGTVIGISNGSIATADLFGIPGARYDSRRFSWVGSMGSNTGVTVAWAQSQVQTTEDLFQKELVVVGAGTSTDTAQFPTAVNRILGARFKVITGYTGTLEIALAIERGEVQGVGSWNYDSLKANRPDWLRDKKVRLLLQLGLTRHPELPDVPTVLDVAQNDEQRALLRLVFTQQAIGRPIIGPPGMPSDVLALYQKAFSAMMADPKFREDATSRSLEVINPVNGPDALKLVEKLYETDKALVERAGKALMVSEGP